MAALLTVSFYDRILHRLTLLLFFSFPVTYDPCLLWAKPEAGVRHQQGGVCEDRVCARGAAQRWVVGASVSLRVVVLRDSLTVHSSHSSHSALPRHQPTSAATSSPAAAWRRSAAAARH